MGVSAQSDSKVQDVGDVPAVPDVDSIWVEATPPATAGVAPARVQPGVSLPIFGGGKPASTHRWSFSAGAGMAGTFSDNDSSSTLLALYTEWYPIIAGDFALGVMGTLDMDPSGETGVLLAGTQADIRWFLLQDATGRIWAALRAGPAYNADDSSIRLTGYTDLGIDFDVGGSFIELRLSMYLTGTAFGVGVTGGYGLY